MSQEVEKLRQVTLEIIMMMAKYLWPVAALALTCFTQGVLAQVSSGTAFAVAPERLVTNEHVVAGCTSVEVIGADGRRTGSVVDADDQIDLALLRVTGIKGPTARLRKPRNIRLGESVMVFGYPLAGSLTSGGNFTSGLVSGLRGLRDAAGELQITAPVQPGNSGGPLMDSSGLVIGVVQAKLDALRSAIATGDIPQNVNFAISLEVLADFLVKNKIAFRDGVLSSPLDTARVAAMAQSFTYRVECRGRSRQEATSAGAQPKPPIESKPLTAGPPGSTFKDCADCPEMVVIPTGGFVMGSNDGSPDERPAHAVNIGLPYAMAKTEVTQVQWRALMGNLPSQVTACDACPVESVNWDDAQEFVRRLSQKTGKAYRLPSEAEWEYACRAGKTHTYCGSDNVDAVAWHRDNSGSGTHPVGGKQPNAWGLYDMSGNAREWVEDCLVIGYFDTPTNGNPWTRSNCNTRILRGGFWNSDQGAVRAATRHWYIQTSRNYGNGFRPARNVP